MSDSSSDIIIDLDYIIMFTNLIMFASYAFLETSTWVDVILMYLGICVLNDLIDLVLYD
jgi:hypothetical protein